MEVLGVGGGIAEAEAEAEAAEGTSVREEDLDRLDHMAGIYK